MAKRVRERDTVHTYPFEQSFHLLRRRCDFRSGGGITHTYAVNPYYAITLHPAKWIESSWRVHSLELSKPCTSRCRGAASTQARQAIHFNTTASYNIHKGIWLGANAYYFAQITDRRINGIAIPNSPERVTAIGPGAVLTTKHTFFYINEYQEFSAPKPSNRSETGFGSDASVLALFIQALLLR